MKHSKSALMQKLLVYPNQGVGVYNSNSTINGNMPQPIGYTYVYWDSRGMLRNTELISNHGEILPPDFYTLEWTNERMLVVLDNRIH